MAQDDDTSFRGEPFARYLNADPLAIAHERREVALVSEGQPSLRGSRLLGLASEPLPRLALLYSVPEEEKEKREGEEVVDEPTLQWIAFRVIDEETEQPCAGVQMKIKLPTGEVGEFTTDGGGQIRIDGLQPGSCDIEKMLDDHAYEVVKVA